MGFAGILLASIISDGPVSRLAYAQSVDSSIEFAENGTSPVGWFRAYDQDGDTIRWSLGGPDADRFTIEGGVLRFKEPPDYEEPHSAAGGAWAARNVYKVTIEASGGTHDVAVTVTDVDEVGRVTIDRPQPQVSRPLGAILSDEDDGVSAQTWQWARSEDLTTWTDIKGATSPRRSPAPDDVGMYLRATVTYSDKFGSGKTASAVSANTVEPKTLSNSAPSFTDQDEIEDTPYIDVFRSVVENTGAGTNIGSPVSAMDADHDILFYELLVTPDLQDQNGRARFTINNATGQIVVAKSLGADEGEREDEDSTALRGDPALPQEEDADDAGNGEYVLRVKVSDPSTASATVNVIVAIADVNEAPHFVNEDAPTLLKVREHADPPVITLEDGETPLGSETFAVADEDGILAGPHPYDDTSYTYSVSGPDGDVLAFASDGVLSFRADHEIDYEEQSSYSITIVARSGEGPRRLNVALDVTIEVVNGEDSGEVVLSQREPQVGTAVLAVANDPDGGVRTSRWIWEQSSEITVDQDGTPSAECRDDPGTPVLNVVGGWTRIDGATSAAYTPRQSDVGRCLRATATYTDNIDNPASDDDERETGTTEAPVQARSPSNAAPHFVGNASSTSRRVAEDREAGYDIGAPVSAHDDDGELVMYTLGGADAGSFSISRNDGQLKTRAPLDYETSRSHTVIVTATDPSGASESIRVTIRVNDVDEPAEITGRTLVNFVENGVDPVADFSARDQDGDPIRWSLSGRDHDLFTIRGGVLAFREAPDYEDPQSAVEGAPLSERNVYRVTIEAADGTHNVAVTVTDVDEAGTVSISRLQPQVDRTLHASLGDEDEGVTAMRWQWSSSTEGTTWTDIEGATSPRRSPTLDDVDMYLRAKVTYSDRFGSDKTVSAVSAYRVEARTAHNAAPSFADQDEDETTSYVEVTRAVAENSAVGTSVGEPITAADADEDVLFYELLDTPDLEDEDGHVRFTIDSVSGQLRVRERLGADAGERVDEDAAPLTGSPELPEGEDAGEPDNSEYVLRVRVSDPSTASATVNVIVKVTEVNEAPAFDEDAPTALRVRENDDPAVITLEDGTTPVNSNTYAVTDEDGSIGGPEGYDDTSYTYSVSGDDGKYFEFDSEGVLSFKAGRKPDFEERESYSITVVAHSGEGPRRQSATLNVTIEVVNTHDVGEVQLSQRQPQVGIEIVATLSDPDGGVAIIRWVWERSVDGDLAPSARCEDINADGDWTLIGDASSAIYLPKPADVGMCLRATAVYTDNLDETELRATGVLEVPVRGRRPADTPVPDRGFVNAAPVFPDQDFLTAGDQSDTASRTVPENTEAGRNIGSPVSAHDDDGDLLIYTLGGADAAFFRITRRDGQLRTRAPLNYEARNAYTVVVTATDPFGAADSIVVTINVTDEDDPPVITVLTVGDSQTGDS